MVCGEGSKANAEVENGTRCEDEKRKIIVMYYAYGKLCFTYEIVVIEHCLS